MNFLIILIFFLPSILSTNSSNPDPFSLDGSEKVVEKWLDGFHKALKIGKKEQVKEFFTSDAIMYACEKNTSTPGIGGHWKPKLRTRDELWDYLVQHRTEIRFVLNFSNFYPKKDHMKAVLSIFGFGVPHLAPINFLMHDGRVYFGFTEYLACGMATLNRCE